MSSTIFNTNINEIQTGRLLRSSHITNIYRVLGGEINNIDNKIDFTGSATFGQDNVISDDAIAPNFILGSNNFIDAGVRNAIVMGARGIGHVDNSLTLASDIMVLDDEGNEEVVDTVNGDSQSIHYVRSLRVSAESDESTELPTRNRTITYFKLSVVGVDASDSSNRGFYEYSFGFVNTGDPINAFLIFEGGDPLPHTVNVNGTFAEPPSQNDVGIEIGISLNGNPSVTVDNQTSNITGWTINVQATETSLTPGIEVEDFPDSLFPTTPAPD